MLDITGYALIVNGNWVENNVAVYVGLIVITGQFGVCWNDHHVNMVVKEECLKYPYSLLTFPLV